MSMTNDAGYRSGATHSRYTTSDSRRDSVSSIHSTTTTLQLPHQFAPPLLWMFLSFGAGIILTSTWNRIRRTFWRNDYLKYQQQRGNDLPQPRPTLDDSRERNDDVQKSMMNSAVVKDTLESPKEVAKTSSSKPKWPWDRLKKGRPTTEKPTSDDSNKENITDNHHPDHHDESADHHQQPDQRQQCCIGSIFGMDVGGTLAKLCYFESHSQTTGAANGKSYERSLSSKSIRRRHSMDGRIQYNSKNYNNHSSGSHAVKRRSWVDHHLHPNHDGNTIEDSDARDTMNNCSLRNQKNGTNPTLSQINLRRVQSLVNFGTIRSVSAPKPNYFANATTATTNDHTMALHRFYDFARRLDTYQTGTRDPNLSFYSKELDGSFHFIKFETRRMMRAMDLIRTQKLHYNIHEMGGTGGGAHKFAAIWQQQLGIRMKKQDELDSLVAGMQFVLSTVIGECYTFRPDQDDQARKEKNIAERHNEYGSYFGVDNVTDRNVTDASHEQSIHEQSPNDDTVCETVNETNDNSTEAMPPMHHDVKKEKDFRPQGDEWWWSRKVQRDSISASDSSTYPYLVVTIGTGVSILRVDGPRQYERVSGSTIGGGTYLGLIRLLTDVEDFDDVMRLAECGDPSKVDMMVGDIYGENSDALEKLGLPSNLVASSFGKLVSKDDPAAGLKQEDLARALLLMITNNIGQVAYLNAKIFQTPRIYFVGNFLRHNTISQRRLSYAINYWSKGEMEALFLEHEGYFGALGAFLLAQDISVSDLTRNSVTKSVQLGSKPENLLRHRRSASISNY